MKYAPLEIWFWQRIVSPHMAGLAKALAEQGHRVMYVAEELMSAARTRQGWTAPALGSLQLEFAPTEAAIISLLDNARPDSIHLCQGLRGNGLIQFAQLQLYRRRLQQWVLMESVDDSGLKGVFKRYAYRRLFARASGWMEGVLATGHGTPAWVEARGVPEERVYPFAYFLDEFVAPKISLPQERFSFIFVGQLIERKRVDLLISELSKLRDQSFVLKVIGSGPLERDLRAMADRMLPGRVEWVGRVSISEVPRLIVQSDCLVLPSRHDGWGAVVSEALMVGTPVICSDACGAAGIVLASGKGGVFPSTSPNSLHDLLTRAVNAGKAPTQHRTELALWASCLGAKAGARYLASILSKERGDPEPAAPWHR